MNDSPPVRSDIRVLPKETRAPSRLARRSSSPQQRKTIPVRDMCKSGTQLAHRSSQGGAWDACPSLLSEMGPTPPASSKTPSLRHASETTQDLAETPRCIQRLASARKDDKFTDAEIQVPQCQVTCPSCFSILYIRSGVLM